MRTHYRTFSQQAIGPTHLVHAAVDVRLGHDALRHLHDVLDQLAVLRGIMSQIQNHDAFRPVKLSVVSHVPSSPKVSVGRQDLHDVVGCDQLAVLCCQ